MLTMLEKHAERDEAIALVAEGFDMLEEDLDKERFFAPVAPRLLGVGRRIAARALSCRRSSASWISDGLPAVGRRHRRRQRDRPAHQVAGAIARSRRACCPTSDRSAACSARSRALSGAGARVERRRRRHEAEGRVHDGPPRHDRRRSRQPLRQRHSRPGRASRCSSSTTSRPAGCCRTWRSRSSAASRADAARTAARSSAARPPRCPASMPTANTTSPASSSASSIESKLDHGRSIVPGRRLDRAAVGRPAHQRLLARAARAVRRRRAQARHARAGARRDSRRCAPGAAPFLSSAGQAAARARARQRHGAHHRRRNDGKSAADAARKGVRRKSIVHAWSVPPIFKLIAAARRHSPRRNVARVQHGRRPGHCLRAERFGRGREHRGRPPAPFRVGTVVAGDGTVHYV